MDRNALSPAAARFLSALIVVSLLAAGLVNMLAPPPVAGSPTTYTIGFTSPNGVAADSTGNLYVADTDANTVSRVDPGGTQVTDITNSLIGIQAPTGVAVDRSNGTLYVAGMDAMAGSAYSVFRLTSGGVLTKWTGAFNQPVGLAVGADGTLYVADQGDATVVKVDSGGNVTSFASGLGAPQGLAVDASGNVYVSDPTADTVSKVTSAGVVSTFATSASGLSSPAGLAVDGAGDLYVANYGADTVLRITSAGVVSTFASTGLAGPQGLVVDASGNLYATNATDGTISLVGSVPSGMNANATATAGAQQTATAQANATATQAAANATATAQVPLTATAQANATSTAQAQQTATQVAVNATAAAQAHQTATAHANATATQAAVNATSTAQVPLTATAQANATATQAAANATSTASAQQTATAQANATATALAAPSAPSILRLDPAYGTVAGGTRVTISGAGFAGGATVRFGAAAATGVSVVDANTITATSPGGTGRVQVVVTNPSGLTSGSVVSFSYVTPASVTSLGPRSGPTTGETAVRLGGTNMTSVVGVAFGGTPGRITGSYDQIVYVRPPASAAGTVSVTVTDATGVTTTLPFQYTFVDAAAMTATAATTATAKAASTATYVAARTQVASSKAATATAVAGQPGGSATTAIQSGRGGASDTRAAAGQATENCLWPGCEYKKQYTLNAQGNLWLYEDVSASDLAYVFHFLTACVPPEKDFEIVAYRLEGDVQTGTLHPIAWGADSNCDVTWRASFEGRIYLRITGTPSAKFTQRTGLERYVAPVATSTMTPTPTRTPTRTPTPTPTATERPVVTPDGYEPDSTVADAIQVTVNGAAQTHTFHHSRDVDYLIFVAQNPGVYTIRTSSMSGGARTRVSLQNQLGQQLLGDDAKAATSFADPVTKELGAARVTFTISALMSGGRYVVQVENANPDVYGTDVSYQVQVTHAPFPTMTPTLTPIPSATSTRTPTRTPAPGDVHEPDSTKAQAEASPYGGLPVVHAGSRALSTDRLTGPRHTFHSAGDEDWFVFPPKTHSQPLSYSRFATDRYFVIRIYDLGARNGMTVRPEVTVFQKITDNVCMEVGLDEDTCAGYTEVVEKTLGPDDCYAAGWHPETMAFSRRATPTPTSTPRPGGICRSFIVGPGLRDTATIWVRIKNLENRFYGSDATYSLDIREVNDRLYPPPLEYPSAADRTTDPMPLQRAGLGSGARAADGATVTATPTAGAVRATVNQDRGASYTSSNGDTDCFVPRYVTSDRPDGIAYECQTSPGPGLGPASAVAMRHAADANGLTTMRLVGALALDAGSRDVLHEFELPMGFCVRYSLADLRAASLDESTLDAYYLDENGELKTDGVAVTSFRAATEAVPGELCFGTTHFTDFAVAGVGVSRWPSTSNPENRIVVQWAPRSSGGW